MGITVLFFIIVIISLCVFFFPIFNITRETYMECERIKKDFDFINDLMVDKIIRDEMGELRRELKDAREDNLRLKKENEDLKKAIDLYIMNYKNYIK